MLWDQTETALVPADFWCSSSVRKIRLRFTCHVVQYQCSYLFSVLNKQRSTSVLVNYLQQSNDGTICLLFLKLFFPFSFIYITASLILPCSVDLAWAEISLQLEELVK